MAGRTRTHTPTPGDLLHVLVIDELAALTAYSDTTVKKEADRLLGEILTQGRALGVVVVACVQDPRKEVVSLRNLFTQVIALRLQSASESTMVLGDLAARAPAHTLRRGHPGTAWVVDDDGRTDRVRADYWPDDLIRHAAATWPTRVHAALPAPQTPKGSSGDRRADTTGTTDAAGRPGGHSTDPASVPGPGARKRKPRSPRKPRTPRTTATAGGGESG